MIKFNCIFCGSTLRRLGNTWVCPTCKTSQIPENLEDNRKWEEDLYSSIDFKYALKRMTTMQRRVFRLKGKGFTHKEIAKMLGVSVSSINSRVLRAKQRLKNAYNKAFNSVI